MHFDYAHSTYILQAVRSLLQCRWDLLDNSTLQTRPLYSLERTEVSDAVTLRHIQEEWKRQFKFHVRFWRFADRASWYNFSEWPTLRTILLFYNTFITVLYMFRATSCSSTGGQIVLIQHLVPSLWKQVNGLKFLKYSLLHCLKKH